MKFRVTYLADVIVDALSENHAKQQVESMTDDMILEITDIEEVK